MKKLIFLVIALFILNNCGYTPIYSSKENNFYIKEISQKDRSKLNTKIINNIEKFSNQNSENIIQLEISSNKKIDIISKDKKGDPSRFQMIIFLNINILNKNNYPFDVTSMTVERATGFSKTLGGKPIDFKDVMAGFDKFDVIIVATTADTFLIRFKKIEKIMKNKKKGTLIMDLSEPRTVDEQIATIKGIKLVNPAQINEMIAENTKKRLNAVSSIEEKIDEEIPIIEATLKRISGESLVNAS